MEDTVVIKELQKSFRLPHEQHGGLKQLIVNFWKHKRGYEVQKVLNNISFEVKKGEFFGIVGRNGSGKSTLLKLLAGIYAPDSGLVQVNGSLTPFIELGVGFNPELTGRENIFLNGALLGFNRKEMEAMYDDIVEFAELEKFMDQKLKNYSSGMQVRLAFSVAIRAKSDVLLIDEVLAVGDAQFQAKCFNYFRELKHDGRTIIFISHDMGAVREFCDRAVLIEYGEMKMLGDVNDIAAQYLIDNGSAMVREEQDRDRKKQKDSVVSKLSVKILNKTKNLTPADTLEFEVRYDLLKKQNINLGFSIQKSNHSVAEMNTRGLRLPSEPGEHRVRFAAPLTHFLDGVHEIGIGVFSLKNDDLIAYRNKANLFNIEFSDERYGGVTKIDGEWWVVK